MTEPAPGPSRIEQTAGERLAFALLTSMLIDEREQSERLVLEITDDLRTNVEAISALLKVIRIELSWHAGQSGTTSLTVLGAIAEAFANLPYETAEDGPPDEGWEWGPER